MTPILGTTVLRTGTQRFAFVLEGAIALITIPTVSVSARSVGPYAGVGTPVGADFSKWPFGTRGSYVTDLAFATPGTWIVTIESDAIDSAVEFPVLVAEQTPIAEIGNVAPFSNTKTLETTGGDFANLSSPQPPGPGFPLHAPSVYICINLFFTAIKNHIL